MNDGYIPKTVLKWKAPRVPRNREEKKASLKAWVYGGILYSFFSALFIVGSHVFPDDYPNRTSIPVGIVLFVASWGFIALIVAALLWLVGTSCKAGERWIALGDQRYVYKRIRHVRLWTREEAGKSFRMLSLILKDWRIYRSAIAENVSEDDLRAQLGGKVPVLDGPPTELERVMQGLSFPTWRWLPGVLTFVVAIMMAGGLFLAAMGESKTEAPDAASASQPVAATQPASAEATSQPAAPVSDVNQWKDAFWRLWVLGHRVAWWAGYAGAALSCLVFALVGAAFFLWDKTYRLHQGFDYLAIRALEREGGKTGIGS